MLKKKSWLISVLMLALMINSVYFFSIAPWLHEKEKWKNNKKILSQLNQMSSAIDEKLKTYQKQNDMMNTMLEKSITFAFIKEKLSLSQLSIDTVNIDEDKQHRWIHLKLLGHYNQCLDFLALLASEVTGLELIELTIENKRLDLTFNTSLLKTKSQKTSTPKKTTTLIKKWRDLIPPPPPVLLKKNFSRHTLDSPFLEKNITSMPKNIRQEFSALAWHKTGEIHQNGRRLGVFLDNGRDAYYFGLGLSLEKSEWRIEAITPLYILLKDNQENHWSLPYSLPKNLVFPH